MFKTPYMNVKIAFSTFTHAINLLKKSEKIKRTKNREYEYEYKTQN